jgi:hypothetical protein
LLKCELDLMCQRNAEREIFAGMEPEGMLPTTDSTAVIVGVAAESKKLFESYRRQTAEVQLLARENEGLRRRSYAKKVAREAKKTAKKWNQISSQDEEVLIYGRHVRKLARKAKKAAKKAKRVCQQDQHLHQVFDFQWRELMRSPRQDPFQAAEESKIEQQAQQSWQSFREEVLNGRRILAGMGKKLREQDRGVQAAEEPEEPLSAMPIY